MIKLKPIVLPMLAIMAVPAPAIAGERVEFAYKASELSTPALRAELFKRIELVARQSCRSTSSLAPREWISSCTEGLKEQFVQAIDDEELTLLAAASQPAYRTASR